MELSIGDYVLTGGETAAMVVIDAVVRLLPGVLGDSESALSDSFQTDSGFDAPVYTIPADYEGMKVPEVLLNGNHNEIAKWREKQGSEKYKKVKSKK
jgi:tRNA (guanine37-N1)-methyltransferase